jgi:hypothetical protein
MVASLTISGLFDILVRVLHEIGGDVHFGSPELS